MKKALIFALIIIAVVGVPLWKKYASTQDLKQVETESITMQVIKASVMASGQLIHEHQVKLTSEVIGKIKALHVKEGDAVNQGQLLLSLDDAAFVATVEQHQATVDQQRVAIEKQQLIVENLEQQLQRKTTLYQQKLLDQDAFELISHQVEVAQVELKRQIQVLKQVKAQLNQAKDQLAKTQVHSPINGLVTSLDIKVGETAISSSTNISGSSLMTIADPGTMLAQINVDEADIAQIAINQPAEIIAIAFTDTPLTGKVESIASSAKIAQGRQNLSFAVKLVLENPQDFDLRPGMSCRAEVFIQGEQQRLAAPLKAILTEEDLDSKTVNNYVFIVKEGQAQKIKVKTGLADDHYQEILEGLSPGDQVISGPDKVLRHLKEGNQVKVLEKSKQDD